MGGEHRVLVYGPSSDPDETPDLVIEDDQDTLKSSTSSITVNTGPPDSPVRCDEGELEV